MTLARQLVRALRRTAKEALPDHVASAARLHLLDAIGVGLAAAASPVGAAYRSLARQLAGSGPATVFGHATGASPADAALINGGLIHSLEFDDTHTASIAHGSSVLAPASVAVAEANGASGPALLAAYARGWEVLVRFGLASPGAFQARGFQVTSVGGALAAALVAAELCGLSEDETVAALGIALSQASGVLEFLTNGSSVKSLHPGWAAHGGVIAAMLARAGMTGPETSLDGCHGLFRQFAGDDKAQGRFRVLVEDLGRVWHLPDAAYKFFPCCHYLHPFIEAAGALAERGIGAKEVERLVCRVPAGEAAVICDPWESKQAPATGHAARWSLPVVIAARLIDGRVELATFEAPPSPTVRELAGRMSWEPMPQARFPERFEAEIECVTRTGTAHTIRIDDVYGNATRPASVDAIHAKFRANARRTLAPAAVETLARSAEDLASAPNLDALRRALREINTRNEKEIPTP
jgi:2-methylcitrate dehydratase PrpD